MRALLVLGALLAAPARCQDFSPIGAKRLSEEETAARVALGWLRPYDHVIRKGLLRSQDAITSQTRRFFESLRRKEGLEELVFLSRFGQPLWHRDPRLAGWSFDEYIRERPLKSDAVEQAYVGRRTQFRRLRGGAVEVSVPFVEKGEVQGLVFLRFAKGAAWRHEADARRRLPPVEEEPEPQPAPRAASPPPQALGSRPILLPATPPMGPKNWKAEGFRNFQAGKLEAARKAWERCLALDPRDQDCRAGLLRLEQQGQPRGP